MHKLSIAVLACLPPLAISFSAQEATVIDLLFVEVEPSQKQFLKYILSKITETKKGVNK